MAASEQIERTLAKLDRAKAERDSWKGRNQHNYVMASHLVAALEKELARLLSDEEH